MTFYDFQYPDELRRQAKAWTNPGGWWAEQVLTAPADTDVAAWKERGVTLPAQLGHQDPYAKTFTAAVQAAASDPDVAHDFVTALQGAPLPAHCTQELISNTVTGVLYPRDLVPNAAVPVIDWALTEINDPEQRLDTVRGALQQDTPVLPSTPPEVAAQHEIISRLADPAVREPLAAQIQASEVRVAELRTLPAFGHAAPTGSPTPPGPRPPGPHPTPGSPTAGGQSGRKPGTT